MYLLSGHLVNELFIWQIYDKQKRNVFQISRDCLVFLSVYLGVNVSHQICPSYFKAEPFSLMLNQFWDFCSICLY